MSELDLHFVVMIGSLRRGSYSRAIAETLDELAPDDVAARLLASTGDLPHYDQDLEDAGIPPEVTAMGDAVARANALVIVTPEYNHSVPGTLKNALDWLSRLSSKPLDRKPVAVQTASIGLLGGVRAQMPLHEILASMNAQVLAKPEVVVTQVADKVCPATGLLRDERTRHVVSDQLRTLAAIAAEHRAQ